MAPTRSRRQANRRRRLNGSQPIMGIGSEDVSSEVFGFFRLILSVYNFADQAGYDFLIKE